METPGRKKFLKGQEKKIKNQKYQLINELSENQNFAILFNKSEFENIFDHFKNEETSTPLKK